MYSALYNSFQVSMLPSFRGWYIKLFSDVRFLWLRFSHTRWSLSINKDKIVAHLEFMIQISIRYLFCLMSNIQVPIAQVALMFFVLLWVYAYFCVYAHEALPPPLYSFHSNKECFNFYSVLFFPFSFFFLIPRGWDCQQEAWVIFLRISWGA